MLPPAPCIKGFVECDPGNTREGNVSIPPWQPTDGSVTVPPYSSSRGSVTIPPWQSSKGSFAVAPYNPDQNGVSIPTGSGNKDLFAVYTVTLRNNSVNPLTGLQTLHGPVPFGGTFDPTYSDRSCSFLERIVGCNKDLNSSATDVFNIVYKITNPMYCRLTPVLQTVRVVYSNATDTTKPPATATVQCTVMDGNQVLVLQTSATDTPVDQTIVATPTPATGTDNQYFAYAAQSDFTLIPHETTVHAGFTTPILWLSCISIVVIGLAMRMKRS